MGQPLLLAALDKPITTLIICCCTAVWALLNQGGLQYQDVGLSYDKVVLNGREYWRLGTATFSHISLLHLVFNMSSLWNLGVVEKMTSIGLGEVAYMKYTLVLIVVPLLLVLGIYHALIKCGRDEYVRSNAVGYSCVVFGWMTIVAELDSKHQLNLFGFHVQHFAPFAALVFTSIIIPQASFVGHLSGILVGYTIAWGWFSWMDTTTTFVLWIVFIVGMVHSAKQTHPQLISLLLPFLSYPNTAAATDNSSAGKTLLGPPRMIGGVLMRAPADYVDPTTRC